MSGALVAAAHAACAAAFVAPTAQIDGSRFVTPAPAIAIDGVEIHAVQDFAPAGDGGTQPGAPYWLVDAELALRNTSTEPISTLLAVIDDPALTSQTRVWLDGVLVATTEDALRQDPARPEHTYDHARTLPLSLPLAGSAVLRLEFVVAGEVDANGQQWLALPTQALGLFGAAIPHGTMSVQFTARPVGVQSTIAGGTFYDAPTRLYTWRLSNWTPRVPFRLSYLSTWSALLLVAEVEACPDPWTVIRETSNGSVDWTRRLPTGTDPATVAFCGNLPDVLHGRPFASEQVRAELAALSLDRYIVDAQPVPLYIANPTFDAASVGEAEALYARALRALGP